MLDAPASTSTKQQALETLDSVDSDTAQRVLDDIDDLGIDQRRQALEFLADGDASRATLIDEFDDDALDAFFPRKCGSGGGGVKSVDGAAPTAKLALQPSIADADLTDSGRPGCLENPDEFREHIAESFEQNGQFNGGDAEAVVEYVDSLKDDTKRERLTTIIDDAHGEGGAEFIADANSDTLDVVLEIEVDTSGTPYDADLADDVRAGLTREYSRGHFSTDGWAGDLYDVDSGTEVAGAIARDIEELESSDNVEGVTRVVEKTDGAGTGAYLVDLPSASVSQKHVKGAALELRVARDRASELDSGTLRLSYEPDADLSDMTEEELKDVAKKVYGERDGDLVEGDLSSNKAEFDAVENPDGEIGIYHESKNRKIPDDRDDTAYASELANDIREQGTRYFAARRADGADLADEEMVVYVRTDNLASELRDQFDEDWISVETPPDPSD